MTTNLLKTLYLGSTLTDEELKDIPNYRAELHYHVLYKSLQVFFLIDIITEEKSSTLEVWNVVGAERTSRHSM
jgi:hypothetical protein